MDISAYSYRAALYCPDCIIEALGGRSGTPGYLAEDALTDLARERGIDRTDEHCFDSDDFPKVVFSSQIEDEESCYRCGADIY